MATAIALGSGYGKVSGDTFSDGKLTNVNFSDSFKAMATAIAMGDGYGKLTNVNFSDNFKENVLNIKA